MSRMWMLALLIVSFVSSSSCPSFGAGDKLCSTNADCSVGGTCIRGVCLCGPGRIGQTCGFADQFLNLGSVAVTQPGLDFAPIQYFKPLNDAFERAKATGLSMPLYDGVCTEADGDSSKSFKVTVAPITPNMFTKANLIPSSIAFGITDKGLTAQATGDFVISKARLDLYGGAFCCPCSGADCKDTLCPQVCSRTDASDWIDFSFQATVKAYIDLVYSGGAINGVVASVRDVSLTFNDDSLGANLVCPTNSYNFISNMVKSYFNQMKDIIGPTLVPQLTQELTATANQITSRYQGLQTYVPQPGTYLHYKVVDLTVVQNLYISVDLQAKLVYEQFSNQTKQRNCWINVTYADPASDRALLPPRQWQPITKNLLPSNLYSPILGATRMSRSFFNAMTWAQFQNPQSRKFSFVFTGTGGLAAQSKVSIDVPPFFKIPPKQAAAGDSILRVSLNGTVSSFSCPPTKMGNVLNFTFAELEAAFSLVYDDTPPNPSIAYQVVPNWFSLQSVKNIASPFDASLNSPSLLRSALVGAMNFKVEQLSNFLLEKGNGVLVLPPDLQQIFPDAQLNIIYQGSLPSPAIPQESGYIEMINRCACSSSNRPITGQGIDGTVNICPSSFLSKSYCQNNMRRRRQLLLNSSSTYKGEENHGRRYLTAQEDSDFATVLTKLSNICVTRAPTRVPTTTTPSVLPTVRPSRSPTPPVGMSELMPCAETTACKYLRDVLFFVCPEGQEEKQECRKENSDIYCCERTSHAIAGAALSSTLWLAFIVLFGLLLAV